MAHVARPIALVVAALAVTVGASADEGATPPGPAADQAALDATFAAVHVAADDRIGAAARLVAARASVVAAADGTTGATLRRLDGVRGRIDRAARAVAKVKASDTSVVASIRAAVRAAHAAAKALWTPADGPRLVETHGDGFHARSASVQFRVDFCGSAPVVEVSSASANRSLRTFEPDATVLPDGRFRATLGPDLGGAVVTATACGAVRQWVVFDQGPRRALTAKPPATPQYAATTFVLRAGVAASIAAPGGAPRPTSFEAAPPLPAGLTLDAKTGAVSGTPTAAVHAADYFVIARNRRGAAATTLTVTVAPALPPEVLSLEDGFAVEAVASGLAVPVKMEFAPDGRLFFDELTTGNVRLLDATGALVAQPFATLPVLQGGERGLVGVAVAPDFATSGHVFVYAATPADADGPDRGRVVRFTAVGDVGTDPTVIVDSLPVGMAHNGGELAFGPDGKLYVTVGDTGAPDLAQTDGSRAGRILRFDDDGAVPADNPVAGDPEWCRGLRNVFGLAFHPTTGGLFVTENGPAANDELNFVLPGKNFEWGALPESVPGPQVGRRMVDWSPVIVPTGLTFLGRGAFGAAYDASVFVAGYDQADLRRVVLSGAAFTDVEEELPFARWKDEGGVANKPLDVLEAPDGALLVSTFTAIWRITRY